MRFTRTELSPANKKQYVMAMGKKDIELLKEIALMAHRYTPQTKDMHDSKRRLAAIAKAFAEAEKSVEWDSDEGDRLPLEERQKFKDELFANPMNEVTRLEIIDHSEPVMNERGDLLEGKGRTVIFWDANKQVESSIQDKGRTLKLFISDRKSNDGV